MSGNVLYECDVEKNTECSKKRCHINGGECMRTSKPKYAKLDGKATIVLPVDVDELRGVEGVEDAD